jgi:hypothetical protein
MGRIPRLEGQKMIDVLLLVGLGVFIGQIIPTQPWATWAWNTIKGWFAKE